MVNSNRKVLPRVARMRGIEDRSAPADVKLVGGEKLATAGKGVREGVGSRGG